MNKTTLVLGAMLCIGLSQLNTSHISQAQAAPMSFNQILAMTQQELTDGNYQSVEEDARGLMVLARSPQEIGQALSLLGESFYRRQSYDEATKQWNAVLELPNTGGIEKTQALAHLGLARSYTAQGSYDKAIPHFKVAVDYFDKKKMQPFAAIFSLALVDAYYNAHQNDLALKQIEEAIAIGQDTPEFLVIAYTRRGQISMEQAQFAKARSDFEQVLDLGEAADMKSDYFRFYAQNLVDGLDKMKPLLTDKGELKAGLKAVTSRSTEFDQNVSQVIAIATNGASVDAEEALR